jgi:hypothetical protein
VFCSVALLFFVLSCSVLLCFVLHFIPSSCIPLYSYLRYPLSLQAALDGQDTHDQRGVGTEKKEDRREDERSGEKRTEGRRERRGQEGRGEKRREKKGERAEKRMEGIEDREGSGGDTVDCRID